MCTSLCTLFVEPRVGKPSEGKLEENMKSCMICRHVYSLWAGTGNRSSSRHAVFSPLMNPVDTAITQLHYHLT